MGGAVVGRARSSYLTEAVEHAAKVALAAGRARWVVVLADASV